MSVEITLYPRGATKGDLCNFLRLRGYARCKHIWTWPKGSVHYSWFDEADYKSIVGVEATVYGPGDDDEELATGCSWALHTRTRACASTFDRVEQNGLIREARRRFGGPFVNGWHGKNRYTPISHEARTPAGRGVFSAYEYATQQLRLLEFALPNPWTTSSGESQPEWMAKYDPARVVYNALIPFAVAALEYFFGEAFRILLRYDAEAIARLDARLEGYSRKVDFQQLLAVSRGEGTVEDVVASRYSFQNLSSIHGAFNDWLGIDFWGILRARRRLGRQVASLDEHLQRLIEHRHGVVHRFEFDPQIDREALIALLGTVRVIIDEFVDHLEGARGIQVRD